MLFSLRIVKANTENRMKYPRVKKFGKPSRKTYENMKGAYQCQYEMKDGEKIAFIDFQMTILT
jgi:hypothetical protein